MLVWTAISLHKSSKLCLKSLKNHIFSAASKRSYFNGMDGVRRTSVRAILENMWVRLLKKLAHGYIFGCRFAPRVYNFSKVNIFTPFCDQTLTYQIAGFSYYDILAFYWFYWMYAIHWHCNAFVLNLTCSPIGC